MKYVSVLDQLLDVDCATADVSFDVQGEPGCFRDSQSKVQGNDSGNTAKPYQEPPLRIY